MRVVGVREPVESHFRVLSVGDRSWELVNPLARSFCIDEVAVGNSCTQPKNLVIIEYVRSNLGRNIKYFTFSVGGTRVNVLLVQPRGSTILLGVMPLCFEC